MADKEPPACDKNLSPESLKLRTNLESCIKFGEYVQKTPFVKAILRHIASIPVRAKRLHLMSKLKLESIMSHSRFYPLEANWYMDTILPNSKPKPDEVAMHQYGLLNFRMTLFSYISDDGLLTRYRFTLLVDADNKIQDLDRTTLYFENVIMTYGGFASVETAPEVRWDSVNVVLGAPNPCWGKYCLNLYSSDLITDAIDTLKFDFEARDHYKVLMPLRHALNLSNMSRLI